VLSGMWKYLLWFFVCSIFLWLSSVLNSFLLWCVLMIEVCVLWFISFVIFLVSVCMVVVGVLCMKVLLGLVCSRV